MFLVAVKEHKAKNTHSTYCINPILKRGYARRTCAFISNQLHALQISHRVLRNLAKMPSKKHKITGSSFKQIRIEKYITPLTKIKRPNFFARKEVLRKLSSQIFPTVYIN